MIEGIGADEADLLLRREQQLDSRVRASLGEHAARRLEHGCNRSLVVRAEDRPGGVPEHAVRHRRLDRRRRRDRVEMRAQEERLALGSRLEPRVEVAHCRADPRAGVVLVDRQAAVAQIARYEVGDCALFARWALDGGELDEEIDDLGRHYATSRPARGARAVERGRDELAEERRRARRARLELGMELRRDEPRMVGQLDDLDQPALLERPADHEAGVDELLPVRVVHLVAVAVTLGDDGLAAVDVAGAGVRGELDGLRAEAHRAAEVLDLFLLGQEVDHREGRLGIHLGRVGAVEVADVARELGDRDMHAEADAEVRDRRPRARRGRRGSCPPTRASRTRRGRAHRRRRRARRAPPRASCPPRRPTGRGPGSRCECRRASAPRAPRGTRRGA